MVWSARFNILQAFIVQKRKCKCIWVVIFPDKTMPRNISIQNKTDLQHILRCHDSHDSIVSVLSRFKYMFARFFSLPFVSQKSYVYDCEWMCHSNKCWYGDKKKVSDKNHRIDKEIQNGQRTKAAHFAESLYFKNEFRCVKSGKNRWRQSRALSLSLSRIHICKAKWAFCKFVTKSTSNSYFSQLAHKMKKKSQAKYCLVFCVKFCTRQVKIHLISCANYRCICISWCHTHPLKHSNYVKYLFKSSSVNQMIVCVERRQCVHILRRDCVCGMFGSLIP